MIELQRKLIGDHVRNDAFYKALKEVVTKKSVVIDLGSGTGFLGFLASKLGAKEVVCIESGDIAGVSEVLAERNNIKNCSFIAEHSTQLETDAVPKADILVSETLGNYALEENIIESIEDAKRFLKKDAVILPRAIHQFVCPVVSDRIAKDIDVWNAGYGLDLSEAREISMHNMYVKTLKKEDLLAEKDAMRMWDSIDFSKENDSVRTASELWKVEKPTTVYGFALWWDAELTKDVHLSTSPLAPATHWEQIYLPLLHPITLKKGESCRFDIQSDTRWEVKVNLTWTASHIDTSGKEQSSQVLDMQHGYLN